MEKFTEESLLAYLIAKYAYLNDNNERAQSMFDLIMSKKPR